MHFTRILTSFVCTVALLAGCGGGGGSPGAGPGNSNPGQSTPLGSTAPSSLTLQNGSAQSFTISGGTSPYTAVSNNIGVAAATVNGNALTIGGIAPGAASVTVFDAANAQISVGVSVTVPDLASTAPSGGVTIAVGPGSAQLYSVSGGVAPYTATSSNVNVATVSQPTASTIAITGVTAGTATIAIRDKTGKTVSIPVTVSSGQALFTTAPNAITLAVGNNPSYTISGGSGPYTVTSSNTSAVTASQPTPTTFQLTAVSSGAASVVVRDALGATVTVGVTVSASQMSVNPTTVNAFIGDVVYTTLSGGTSPYTIVQGFPQASDVEVGFLSGTGVFTPNSSGNVLRIVVKQAVASNSIVVRDVNNNTATFTLSASAGTNAINLSPKAVTISGAAGSVTINEVLYGGVGTVNLFSSDTTVLTVASPVTASSSGTPVTITKAAGEICGSPTVMITAIDSMGQSATSTISVVTPITNGCP